MLPTLRHITVLLTSLVVLSFGATKPACKVTPDSPSWPSPSAWHNLNASIAGRLLQPPPPGGVCHPEQSTYNAKSCPNIQASWLNQSFHSNNPISVDYQNWNNDSCLPNPKAPCSGAGYPVYVVNASSSQHVKAGVDFARKHNVRLIVKGSGHDYLGRSSAPNSLSIWVRHISGMTLNPNFHPSGCGDALNTSAVTASAGDLVGDIYRFLRPHKLAIVGGMAQDISIGGHVTGGGHSAISSVYGLAADNVLELTVVTPQGAIVTANECQHQDLFWAIRGGGGSTFGVITAATLRTVPTPKIGTVSIVLSAPASASEAFWDTMTYLFKQMPSLAASGVSGYIYGIPAHSPSLPPGVDGPSFYGLFMGVNQSSTAVEAALQKVVTYGTTKLPATTYALITPTDYTNFYDFWWTNHDTSTVGNDVVLGSRLLNNVTIDEVPFQELKTALVTVSANVGFNGIMVAGKGVWDAKPRGGGNAVNPAWRNGTAVHLVTWTSWPALNAIAKQSQLATLEKRIDVLRKLAPHSGCYLNEADPNEPDYQHAFWGDHYPRLLDIKRRVDPDDVFVCHPCVGFEGWREEGGRLCRV